MANQKLDEVMELLNKVKERQDKYEKDYLKKTKILLVIVLQVKRKKWNSIKNL